MRQDNLTIKSQDVIQAAVDLATAKGHQAVELLHRSIRPEFLNRIDEIIMFNPLTRKEIRHIVDMQLRMIRYMVPVR